MSNKSGVAANIIAQPQGGGALKGIGEKFTPNLQTGTGNFTIPLELPPGRNGFQPDLKLAYSTGNGNGFWGLGWSLPVSNICRQTARGIPTYVDTADRFILSGAEDLVPVAETATVTRYQPRTEGLFARIEHHVSPGNNFWKVWSKDGLVSFFGTPRPADADPDWEDPAIIADPTNRSHIFCWQLSLTRDTFGNRIEYRYVRDTAEIGAHHFDQLYLDTVRYVDYTNEQGETEFLVSLKFEYEDRPDPFSSYRAGFEVRTRRRCRRLTIQTHADTDRLVRSYEWTYLDERTDLPNLADRLPRNAVSLVSRYQVTGHKEGETELPPPLELAYTAFRPGREDLQPVIGAELPAHSLNHPHIELADLFGNGLPDIIEMDGAVRYWRNLGNGKFARPQFMDAAPAGLRLGDPGVQLIDANANGRIDLLVTEKERAGYFPLQFTGRFDRRSFQSYQFAPTINLEQPEVKLLDLNGNGVTDALQADGTFNCFFNDPQTGWETVRRVARRPLDEFPNVNFDDPRVKLADMSGDGMQDIVLVHDGNVAYWPNLGHGNWGKQVFMTNSPRFPFGYNPRRILLGDVDGDGTADLIYVDDRKVTLYLNQAGNGWSDPIEIKGTPRITDLDAVRLVDLLGSGTKGLLWSADAAGNQRQQIYFLNFINGGKPYLLDAVDNHRGTLTRIGYASSTQFYLADEARPETRWHTPLPFPVQVVATTEAIDQLSGGKMTTTYRYHHGYWDGDEREFRGFGMVEQADTESFADYHASGLHDPATLFEPVDGRYFSPPTLTKTWFHLGPITDETGAYTELDYQAEYWSGDPSALGRPHSTIDLLQALPPDGRRDALRALRGQTLRTELYALDGSALAERPYSVTEIAYALREEAPSPNPDRQRVFFPHQVARRTSQWERGSDPMTRFMFVGEYDAYGLAHSQIEIGVPRGRNYRVADPAAAEPYLAVHNTVSFAQRDDADVYIVDRIAQSLGYEIGNDGRQSVYELAAAIVAGSAARELMGHRLNFYDGTAYQGLPAETIGAHGALTRSEELVLTAAVRDAAYATQLPPYLVPGAPPVWTADYPQPFRDQLPQLAGYHFHPGDGSEPHQRGYYRTSKQHQYDFHTNPDGRGLMLSMRDPLAHTTTIAYDAYAMLPTTVTEPTGLTTRADYDYRVLQPALLTEPNGNRVAYDYTPLGLIATQAVMGRAGETDGDTPDVPGTRWEYDLQAFVRAGQPVSIRTIQRQHHVSDTHVPLPEREATITKIEYSDGFGRLLQTRAQAQSVAFDELGLTAGQTEPVKTAVGTSQPDRVVVSGWQIYDNKGRVVEKYEPFFSRGEAYAPPEDTQLGRKTTIFYDPRGQAVRTLHSDGSEQIVLFGVPADLADPTVYTPTPWEQYVYDANDNGGRTHGTGDASHFNTPTSSLFDARGEVIETVVRNGTDPAEWLTTSVTYDIRGNVVSVTDPLGRLALNHIYDFTNNALRSENLDKGVETFVYDAAGMMVETRDAKHALILHGYDVAGRPDRLWARDNAAEPVTLRLYHVFGDSPDAGLTPAEQQLGNLLGRLYQLYDEAGLVTVDAYDFKGNAVEKKRQPFADATLLAGIPDGKSSSWQVKPFRVDWQPPAGTFLIDYAAQLLAATVYHTSMTYDALNRAATLRYPADVTGKRQLTTARYDQSGALEQVMLDGTPFVQHIAYNARGQRQLIAYGNGVMTRHVYDDDTFRLVRLRSERYTATTVPVYKPTGSPLQDTAYEYDLVGNITAMHERTPGCGIPNSLPGPDALDRDFTYDPLYRLLSATGRETAVSPGDPWLPTPRSTDVTQARAYVESYRYDEAGNLIRLSHQHSGGGFARDYPLQPGTNRLQRLTIGKVDFDHAYDGAGNLVRETSSRHFEWDYENRLRAFRQQVGTAEPSVYTQYLYDSEGQRVQKLTRKQGGHLLITVYVDGLFEHTREVQGKTTQANNQIHILDNRQRIAQLRVGTPLGGDTAPALRYHLGDHLGSSHIVLDANGSLINREEYTPYGDTSFGSFARKRYRFTGKERDEESGLYYHGARYYAPWLCRWTSTDPAGPVDGLNLYTYVQNNPSVYHDPEGTDGKPAPDTTGTEAPKEVDLYRRHAFPDVHSFVFDNIKTEGSEAEYEAAEKAREEFLEVIKFEPLYHRLNYLAARSTLHLDYHSNTWKLEIPENTFTALFSKEFTKSLQGEVQGRAFKFALTPEMANILGIALMLNDIYKREANSQLHGDHSREARREKFKIRLNLIIAMRAKDLSIEAYRKYQRNPIRSKPAIEYALRRTYWQVDRAFKKYQEFRETEQKLEVDFVGPPTPQMHKAPAAILRPH